MIMLTACQQEIERLTGELQVSGCIADGYTVFHI